MARVYMFTVVALVLSTVLPPALGAEQSRTWRRITSRRVSSSARRGSSAKLTLRRNILTEQELQNACPLTPAQDESNLLLRAESPSSQRECCSGGQRFFTCVMVMLKPQDKVQWVASDEDIPPYSVGVVEKVNGPVAHVRFHTGTFPLMLSGLIKVNTPKLAEREKSYWSCDCDSCSQLHGLYDVTVYNVHELKARFHSQPDNIYLHASISPKGLLQYANGPLPQGHRYVLFLYPEEDDTHAFAFKPTLCERIHCWQKREFMVVMRIVGTRRDAWNVLEQFPDRSIHHLILGGHGSSTALQWSSAVDGQLRNDLGTKKLFALMRNKTAFGGSVILDACQTAGHTGFLGGDNLFTFTSKKFFGRRVIGSKVNLDDDMWHKADDAECLAGDTVVFKEDGQNQMSATAVGYPKCKEIWPSEMEAFARSGKLCLTRCRYSCSSEVKEWKAQHKFAQKSLYIVPAHIQVPSRESCMLGSKSVCKTGWFDVL